MSAPISDEASSKNAITEYLSFEKERQKSYFSLRRKFLVIKDDRVLCCGRIKVLWHQFMGATVHLKDVLEQRKTKGDITNFVVLSLYQEANNKKNIFELINKIQALPNNGDEFVQCKQILNSLIQFVEGSDPNNSAAIGRIIEKLFQEYPKAMKAWIESRKGEKNSPIIQRFFQIQAAVHPGKIEINEMPLKEIFKIAYFIETKIQKTGDISSRILKQRATGLARTIQYSKSTGTLYILARHKISVLRGYGAAKRVVSAAAIPLQNYQLHSLHARVFTLRKLEKSQIFDVKYEYNIAQAFWKKDKRYFLQPHTICQYSLSAAKRTHERVSMIMEAGTQSLDDAAQGGTLRIQDKLRYASDIVNGVNCMHDAGYLHNDLKPRNLIVHGDGIKIIDFGYAQTIRDAETARGSQKWGASKGVYATIPYTAPEFLLVPQFSGDNRKVEMFAVGDTLWELLHDGKYPPWYSLITKAYKDRHGSQLPDRAQIKEQIIQYVERPLQDFLALKKCDWDGKQLDPEKLGSLIAQCSDEERYKILMYQLLRFDPENRWDAKQASAWCKACNLAI